MTKENLKQTRVIDLFRSGNLTVVESSRFPQSEGCLFLEVNLCDRNDKSYYYLARAVSIPGLLKLRCVPPSEYRITLCTIDLRCAPPTCIVRYGAQGVPVSIRCGGRPRRQGSHCSSVLWCLTFETRFVWYWVIRWVRAWPFPPTGSERVIRCKADDWWQMTPKTIPHIYNYFSWIAQLTFVERHIITKLLLFQILFFVSHHYFQPM